MATIDIVTPAEMENAIKAAVEPLQRKIQFLEKFCLLKTVDTKTASMILSIHPKTLERERERPNTLIRYGKTGPKQGKIAYDVMSLFDYLEERRIKHLHGKVA